MAKVNIVHQESQLASQPAADHDAPLKEQIIAALKNVYDPELPVNIYDLGLIYEINTPTHETAEIIMTLTTPNCPVAEMIPSMVADAVRKVKAVKQVKVNLVWEPAWHKGLMSEEAKLELGML